MTAEIALVYGILLFAVVLFVTEWLRMDLVALLVLVAVALTGLVPPGQVFAGFSSPAVITVWAVFIITGGLTLTGVADRIGALLARFARASEASLIVVIMGSAALLSAVMNNVGVTALMLPAVIDVARRSGRAPSRLLIPLSFGVLLGGMTTLIGTPPNVLVSDALADAGLEPFHFFDFTPIGGALTLGGIVFVAFVGRHLLPERDPVRESGVAGGGIRGAYGLGERVFIVRLPADSGLAGLSMAESRLGAALGLNVVAVLRGARTWLAPPPATVLRGGDRLLALGREELVGELREGPEPLVLDQEAEASERTLPLAELVEAPVPADSPLVGRPLFLAALREQFGVNVLAIRRGDSALSARLQDRRIEAEDVLLVQGLPERTGALAAAPEFGEPRPVSRENLRAVYRLHERMLSLRVPEGSPLAGRTLAETRLGDALGLTVYAIHRSGEPVEVTPQVTLQAGDTLLAEGSRRILDTLRAWRDVEIESHPIEDVADLASAQIALAEVVLSPQTTLEGRTLRELEFRDRYGLSVLAIWRRDQAYRTNLRDMELRFGDALLVHGPRERAQRLARDPDFIVVSETIATAPHPEKGPLALLIVGLTLLPVIVGLVPVAVGAVTGATLMVLLRCLTMEQAYRFIEWPVVFLIAGMLPLGTALERTGGARLAAEGVIAATGGLGAHGVLAGLVLLAVLAKVIVPGAALTVIMIPVAFSAAAHVGVSPLPFLMAVAMAASISFLGPVAHPSNTIVTGPGGYRFMDFLRIGVPLTLLAVALVVLLAPVLWPF